MNAPATRSLRGADALARTLVAAGVKRIFTLSGNHIMPVFDAALEAGLELVHVRHEASAVHMADAWARLTGAPGIAMVTGGPGHANAVSALYTAQMSESAMVLLSGHAPNNELGRGAFQEMRQAEMAAPVTKASWTCAGPQDVARDMAKAMRLARSGRKGPVHLSLPSDALESPAADGAPAAADFAAEVLPPADDAVAAAIARLSRAKRPLVIAGAQSLTRPGRAKLAALEAALGLPVAGSESPRGVNDPSLGAFAEVLAQADCVLLLGKRLDFTLRFGESPVIAADCGVLQFDADEAERARAKRAFGARLEVSVPAEPFATIDALITACAKRKGTHAAWRDEVHAAIAYRPAAWDGARGGAGRLHPVEALRPLQAILDSHPDSVMVCDGGEFGQWTQACLSAPHRVINGAAGAIGAALPMALAAPLAVPGAPVLAFMGDGTFGFHCAEFDTAVRHRLPFAAVIGNDARWNAEYQIQLKAFGPDRLVGCELLPTRYDQVAAAFGAHGVHVDAAAALHDTVKKATDAALASKRPACVNVALDGQPAPVVRRAG
ncbi:MAG TPA: thiamine pyrophosphate-binding protein [Burkholderiales bacterium]